MKHSRLLMTFCLMALPAIVYAAINWGNPATISGWAIPAATDIAFAMGVLGLLGNRCPASLRLFLLTVAIVDDMSPGVVNAASKDGPPAVRPS